MKRITKALTTTAAAAMLAVAVPAGNAAAINETGCGPKDLLRINYDGGSLCFANSGTTDMYQIPNVTSVSTGNNAVQLRGPGGTTYSLLKWSSVTFPRITIDYIRIV
ncbi:beta/gamma crystallin domain-containing protein [Streptomyces sp. NPDC002476]|uniref:beta/gamma crystallin domain-containing protein n=1 Tax=Streptomyces sp. NPDC002476 TaxID=3364648 RepID=UPI0036B654B9